MSDRSFLTLGLLAALCIGSSGIYLWGLILGWWSA